MVMKKATEILAIEIDTAIQLIVAATRNATLAAVKEAFRSVDGNPPGLATTNGRSAAGREPRVHRKAPDRRRSSAEISDLAERLIALLNEQPGKTMGELAQAMGVQAADLAVPMAQLKKAGRVKAIGRRQFTRYYPRTESVSGDVRQQEAA